MQASGQSAPAATAPIDMLDLEAPRTAHRLRGLTHSGEELSLDWDDGRISRFHVLWLRDNCACPRCRHPQALERTYTFIDHGLPVIRAARAAGDAGVEIEFAVGDEIHRACFDLGWLRRHCNSEAVRAERARAPRLWDATEIRGLPVIDFDAYMNTDQGFRAWLEALRTWGIVLLRNIPAEPGRLLEVAHRVGPIRNTNFGECYDVISMPNPNASAYTAMGLELHTDLANWRFPPDYQLLYCVKNSVTGGESVLVDGYRVAEDLRHDDPHAFELLSTHALDFRFHDDACDIRASGPTIELDARGAIVRIRFNNWLRATMQVPQEHVAPLYGALGTFWHRLRQARYRLDLRLEPGNLITYYNHRILHGRMPFDPGSGERHLQGCYVHLEDAESRLQLLDRPAS